MQRTKEQWQSLKKSTLIWRSIFDVGNTESLKKTISIGIAKFPTDGDTIWKCIKYADTALYVAKDTGRNKIVEFKADMFKTGDEF
jgi:diguanylate cyclase (GGDEF)-like protein